MKSILFLALALVAISFAGVSGEQQRILRRVIKSTPTASNLTRIRVVTTRSSGAERGAVSEISSKEAANFGQRSQNNESTASQQQQQVATKTKQVVNSTPQAPTVGAETTPASSTTPASTTSTTAAATSASTVASSTAQSISNRVSERQQAEVELLSSAPSSWQMMTAVEAPAAALIAAGTRPAQDLSSSSSDEASFISNNANNDGADFLRSSGIKGGSSSSFSSQTVGETFSRLRQQSTKRSQTSFYPQQQRAQSKTSNFQATKTHWYQPSTTSTTPRPAPIIQQQEQQQEQQYEQYVEQQVEGAAPPGQAEPFAFDFKTQDQAGNGQYRKEESDKNGVVRGSYGYWSDGIYRQVNYIADENGFRAQIQSNEPGMKKDAEAPASVELRS